MTSIDREAKLSTDLGVPPCSRCKGRGFIENVMEETVRFMPNDIEVDRKIRLRVCDLCKSKDGLANYMKARQEVWYTNREEDDIPF